MSDSILKKAPLPSICTRFMIPVLGDLCELKIENRFFFFIFSLPQLSSSDNKLLIRLD